MLKFLKHRFKEAVTQNFDESVDAYERFEARHHLFRELAQRVCDLVSPAVPSRILDVGCGTGISTIALRRAFPEAALVLGLDISEKMLARARERYHDEPGVYFLNGDAEELDRYFHENFDAVFYTASVFLIPNYRKSLAEAVKLLVPNGVLGITFYEGIFDGRRRDLMAREVPGTPYRYGALEYGDLKAFLDEQAALKTTQVDYFFEIEPEMLRDYLSIPAQSAGLFPEIASPDERSRRVKSVCDSMEKGGRELFMGWKIVVCRKR